MEVILIPLIIFLGFVIKGISGTGVSTIVVGLGAFVIDPKMAVVLASFINIFGGLSMLPIDPIPIRNRYWLPVAAAMILGSIIGAMSLKIIETELFEKFLGFSFLILSCYFIFIQTKFSPQREQPPTHVSPADFACGLFSGFCGGFIGVNAPPLVYHFGRYLDKRYLRRFLVLIFIPAAIAQTFTFFMNGLLSYEILQLAVLSLPAMIAGIYIGNMSFKNLSETLFRQLLGVFLFFVSLKLML